jgi:hypothetical protein
VGRIESLMGGGLDVRQPQNRSLYLPDAPVGQSGQAGQLFDLRHDIAAGLWEEWRHQHAAGNHGHQPAGDDDAGLLFARWMPLTRK